MANSICAIPMRMLYGERNDPQMDTFIADLDIDLNAYVKHQHPTVLDLQLAIKQSGLNLTVAQFQNAEGEQGWSCSIKENDGYHTLISVDKVQSEQEAIKEMFYFSGGQLETYILVMLTLVKNTGDLLLYCDSGQMCLLTKTKTVEEVLSEFS